MTVVSDGQAYSFDPKRTFSRAVPAEIDAAMHGRFLATDRVVMNESVALVDIPGRRVMFDCGSGTSTLFGSGRGRLLGNLAAAGVAPASIEAIVLRGSFHNSRASRPATRSMHAVCSRA